MSQSYLWSNYFTKQKRESLLEILSRVPLFTELSRKELKAIERILHRRMYRAGEYVFHAGELGLGMYIIEQGNVAILAPNTENEVALLTDGDFFGELALLQEETRTVHAIARTDAHVFGFSRPDLLALLERKPRLGVSVVMKLAYVISRRLDEAIVENERLLQTVESLHEHAS